MLVLDDPLRVTDLSADNPLHLHAPLRSNGANALQPSFQLVPWSALVDTPRTTVSMVYHWSPVPWQPCYNDDSPRREGPQVACLLQLLLGHRDTRCALTLPWLKAPEYEPEMTQTARNVGFQHFAHPDAHITARINSFFFRSLSWCTWVSYSVEA